MTTTNNITKTTARGFGRRMQRLGVALDRAVAHAMAECPELATVADAEGHIRRGWNAEKRGR